MNQSNFSRLAPPSHVPNQQVLADQHEPNTRSIDAPWLEYPPGRRRYAHTLQAGRYTEAGRFQASPRTGVRQTGYRFWDRQGRGEDGPRFYRLNTCHSRPAQSWGRARAPGQDGGRGRARHAGSRNSGDGRRMRTGIWLHGPRTGPECGTSG